jgi:hypothetical protein
LQEPLMDVAMNAIDRTPTIDHRAPFLSRPRRILRRFRTP